MNKRELHQLLRAELITAINYTIDKIIFLISVEKILDGKDNLSEAERFSTSQMNKQDKIYTSLKEEYDANHTKAIKHICNNSSIISNTMKNNCLLLLQELSDLEYYQSGPFYIYKSIEKDKLTDAFLYFKSLILTTLKINAVINEMEIGLQEYGVDSYKVSDKDSKYEFDICEEVYSFTIDEIDTQLEILLSESETDSEIEYEDKIAIANILKRINKKGE